jgi:hypothetical protein
MDAKLIRKLDLWFSRVVRYRAAGKGGFAQCFTCSVIDSVVQMDNGHYLDRAWLGTRFHEDNCRIQCRKCNRLMTGNIPRYKIMLTKDIGEERISELEELKDKPLALSDKEANELVRKWRAECRSIRLDKNF